MSPIEANDAYKRVSDTITSDEEITISGVLKGILLESWKFDFFTNQNLKIAGEIDDNLSEKQAINLSMQYFNKSCLASLTKINVLFKNGRMRITYRLKGLQQSPLRSF